MEESTNRIFELNEHYGINLGEIEVGVVAVEALVNEIYNDFESRTCENCKYYGTEHENIYHQNYRTCINKDSFTYMEEPHFKDGCNKFKRKTDE